MSFSVRSRSIQPQRLGSGEWFQPQIIHLGLGLCAANLRRSRWQDAFWKIYYNLDGGTEIAYEGGSAPLDANRIGVLPPWQMWQHITHQPVRHFNISVDAPQLPASVVRREFLGLQTLPQTPLWRSQADALNAVVAELDLGDPPSLALSCRVQAVVYTIFEHLFRRLSLVAPPPPIVRAAIDAIELGIVGDCRMRTLARASGVGEKSLNAAFRAAMGVSAAEYVRERRIARAADLLLSSAWSIDRIASEAGFPNRHYLSRVFARRMGVAPAAYRARRPTL
jgi:AraC family transcriptional regulator of arabinose operon